MESFVLKSFETRHLSIKNNISLETEFSVDCSKVIWFIITAFFSFPRLVLPCIPDVPLNTTVCLGRCQPPYHMESFVSGSETVYLTISNYISFGAELHVDCNVIFLPQTSFAVYPGRALKYYRMFKQASAPISYGKFCIKRLWDRVSYHIKLYIIWRRITCRLQ